MSRTHAFIISIALGIAAIAGATAAVRTAQLGEPAAASKPPTASLTARARVLDRQEAALRRALATRPPKLPAVPSAPAPPTPPAAAPAALPPAPTERFDDDHSGHGRGGGDDDD